MGTLCLDLSHAQVQRVGSGELIVPLVSRSLKSDLLQGMSSSECPAVKPWSPSGDTQSQDKAIWNKAVCASVTPGFASEFRVWTSSCSVHQPYHIQR
jgi:hypothetical protein